MVCPDCGVGMNHHADKLVYGGEAAEAGDGPGGVVEEAHSCPKCGKTLTRREGAGESEAP
ncbi:MAG TPA: hypothetical protein VE360_15090 [Pyrinomonadaceae bacterium]|nr:hypothetical protein [Pyrinomonadaceae bacterium]